MNPRRTLISGVGVGLGLAGSAYGLVQDLMGKEGYIEYVQTHWVRHSYALPIEILGLVVAFATFVIMFLQSHRRRLTGILIGTTRTAVTLDYEYDGRESREDRTAISGRMALQLGAALTGAAVAVARAPGVVGAEIPAAEIKNEEREPERKTAWEKIDLRDLDDQAPSA
jgi:hypothetical protein